MGNPTDIIVLQVASGSSSCSAYIIVPDGLNIPRRGGGALV